MIALAVYFAIGLAIALATKQEPGTIGFRLITLPGRAALWPWLLLRRT